MVNWFSWIHSLKITVQGEGSTSPKGTITSFTSRKVTVTATPAQGWEFDHWVYDGQIVTSHNSITVTI